MRPFKNRASANGEVSFASVTTIIAVFARRNAVNSTAARAKHAVSPAAFFYVFSSGFFARKQRKKLKSADG